MTLGANPRPQSVKLRETWQETLRGREKKRRSVFTEQKNDSTTRENLNAPLRESAKGQKNKGGTRKEEALKDRKRLIQPILRLRGTSLIDQKKKSREVKRRSMRFTQGFFN